MVAKRDRCRVLIAGHLSIVRIIRSCGRRLLLINDIYRTTCINRGMRLYKDSQHLSNYISRIYANLEFIYSL
jgi:hypothetical protein